jgi:hypothetical protein
MVDMPEDNDELMSLLSALDEDDEDVSVPEPMEPVVEKPAVEHKAHKVNKVEPPVFTDDAPKKEESSEETQADDKKSEDSKEDMLKDLYHDSLLELRDNYRSDRQELNDYITMLYEKVNTSGPKGPSRVLFEALGAAFRTKSESNSNLVKLIDNVGKKLDKTGDDGDFDLDALLDE